MKIKLIAKALVAAAALLLLQSVSHSTGGVTVADLDREAYEMMRSSFTARGIATMDRLFPLDPINQRCAEAARTGKPLDDATLRQIQESQMRTIRFPADGRFLGEWREGELIAQSGRGLTWTDAAVLAAGGNCFNCHQMTREEISFGNLGPSLLNYGLLRGVTDPNSPDARAIVEYTWGVIWNPRAFFPCSTMPRAGYKGILTEDQVRHVMAFLLDPNSPVNRPAAP